MVEPEYMEHAPAQGQEIAERVYLGVMVYIGMLIILVLGGSFYAWMEQPDCPEPKEVVRYVERDAPSESKDDRLVTLPVTTTGYCPGPPCVTGKWADGKTATGKRVRVGHCASDWTHFPPGTKFVVPGYGPCVVEDSGRLVKGRHLDPYFPTASEARRWGRQTTTVTLVRWGREGDTK